jgi:hypothetical protein
MIGISSYLKLINVYEFFISGLEYEHECLNYFPLNKFNNKVSQDTQQTSAPVRSDVSATVLSV